MTLPSESDSVAYTLAVGAIVSLAGPSPEWGEDVAAERDRLAAIKLLRAKLRDQEATCRGGPSIAAAKAPRPVATS